MIEHIVLGVIQGITEWLPVSSEGMIALAEARLFGSAGIEGIVRLALFLHLGTFLAALVYFRKDVWHLTKALIRYKRSPEEDKKILNFLVISTLISGVLGLAILKIVGELGEGVLASGKVLTGVIGILLLVTAALQLKKKEEVFRKEKNLNPSDGILLGIVQGFAVLPGLSRSGLTVSTLLLRKVEDAVSLRLSFLMSLPIVLAGNIFLNADMFRWSEEAFAGLAASLAFGLLTIHFFLKLARKINFGYFIGIFGVLMVIAALV